jgi:hypothetical protein
MVPGDIGVRRFEDRRASELQRDAQRYYFASQAIERARDEQRSGLPIDKTRISFGWLSLLKLRQLVEMERRLYRKFA